MSTGRSAAVDEENEVKMDEYTGLPVLAQGAVIAQNVGTQHLHSAPHRQAVEVPRLQRVSEGTDREYFQQMFEAMQKQMQEQMQLFMVHQQQTQQQIHAIQQQAVAAAAEQHRSAASVRRQTVSLPSYPTTPAVGEYSAGASLPLPPRVHRSSFGRPSTPAVSIPFTPPAQRAAAVPRVEAKERSDDEEDDTAADGRDAETYMPTRDKRMEQVRKSMLHSVKPFHGRTKLDTYTVIDWVEKLDTEFSIHMGERESGRMDVVRSLLAGQALKWANRRVAEMNARGEEAEWHAVRADFIDAHLGSSTIETFKAELRALRLGSDDCKNPSELNTQFDRLAELSYPMALGLTDRRSDAAMATVLGDEYRRIVAESNQFLWRNIERSVAPTTLDEWKVALARHWSAERTIDNMKKQLRPSQEQQSQRGGGTTRGGRGRGGGSGGGTAAQPTLNAILDTTERGEGETEEQFETQLTAVPSTSQRGGRGGGRGGRGGGGAGQSKRYSPELIKKLSEERKCFNCGQVGHISRDCVNTRVDLSKE